MSDEPRTYCPGCEPEADEFVELLVVSHCGRHLPSRDGLDDAGVVVGGEVRSEAAIQRAWCALIHGDHVEPESPVAR